MKPKIFAFYWYTNEYGKRAKTTWRLTAESAAAQLKDPELVPGSEEVRQCPETPEDFQTLHTGHLQGPPPGGG